MEKRTKIIATIGPASSDQTVIEKMVQNGMDIARLNLSHGTHREHAAVVRTIRAVERKTGKPVGILADLGGPKIRTGIIPGDAPLDLKKGDSLIFAPHGKASGREIPVTYATLATDLNPGDRLLIDDGNISVIVTSVTGDRVQTRVVEGGVLKDHKGINLPGLVLSTSAVTSKDRKDLVFAIKMRVDFIGVSFVQSAEDIDTVRNLMKKAGRIIPTVAKIERSIAIKNLDTIADAADALMVARGDLGVETPIDEVPLLQKRIIATAAKRRKPVIVATQMLESMIEHTRPTRAEVTDVSNAVFEGASCVMLSAETSIGVSPPNAVATMKKIVMTSEGSPYFLQSTYVPDENEDSIELATARAACFAADEAQAKAICVFTMTGNSARIIASQRPHTDIIAIANNEEIARRMKLYWGVRPIKISKWRSIDTMVKNGIKRAKFLGELKGKEKVVVVSGTVTAPGATNMIKILQM
jgi:pyruvate kinase